MNTPMNRIPDMKAAAPAAVDGQRRDHVYSFSREFNNEGDKMKDDQMSNQRRNLLKGLALANGAVSCACSRRR